MLRYSNSGEGVDREISATPLLSSNNGWPAGSGEARKGNLLNRNVRTFCIWRAGIIPRE